ncbi:MAG: CarD family transcriptional regulator [Lachnospiraceae bacterium]|nr:CarD family transcriptional regulator [Lachnospiraceae bacterium]
MYQIGQYVMYGNTGICKVMSIGPSEFLNPEKEYYTLQPIFSNTNSVIYVPTDKAESVRKVLSASEAHSYLSSLKDMKVEHFASRNSTLVSQHYKSLLETHEIEKNLALFKEASEKIELAIEAGKKPLQTDLNFKETSERLLCEELSIALDLSQDEVRSQLASALAE